MSEEEGGDDAKPPEASQAPSFLRRIAGPSAHKAGVPKDQSEINRKIAEASRGSKFYENEKRRDKDWTERIAKILKRRDELLRESDIGSVERKVDRIFAEMEANRDLSQVIVHVDMDAFYANVELQYDASLAGKPFAVVGLGIVTTASYDARKFGVRSAMPEFVAKKLCPDIILVPVNYTRVAEKSGKIMSILREYDPNMFNAGCDEGYINITKYIKEHDLTPEDCVKQLRARIHAETNLTASAGIAPNMMLAKISSDRNKPNGQFQLPFERDAIMDFMRDLPVRKVPYIGRVGERVLEAIGVKTCGDIRAARAIIWLMPRKFAVDFLFKTHLGISTNVIQPAQREERKSVGASRTFRPVDTEEAIYQKLEYIASLLERDLKTEGWTGKTVILTFKLDTFQVFTRMKTFERWISTKEELFKIGKDLLKPELPLRIRLLGLRVTNTRDLREVEDRGIKRFFESDGHSPSKKRKFAHTDDDADLNASPSKRKPRSTASNSAAQENEDGTLVEEELVGEAIEDEDELDEDEDDGDAGDDQQMPPQWSEGLPSFHYNYGNRIKPASTAATSGRKKPPSTSGTKFQRAQSGPPTTAAARRSVSRQLSPAVRPSRGEIQTCPICDKELETDNAGLNEHIDFCLSKGAIMQAASMAGTSGKGKQPVGRTTN